MQALLRQLRCRGGLSSATVRKTHGNMAAEVSAVTSGQTHFSGSMASVLQLFRGLRTANPSSEPYLAARSQRGLADMAGWRHQHDSLRTGCIGAAAVSSAGSLGGNIQFGSIAATTAGCRAFSTSGARRRSAAGGSEPPAEQSASLNPLQASTVGRRVLLLLPLHSDDTAACLTPSMLPTPCKCAFLYRTGGARGH